MKMSEQFKLPCQLTFGEALIFRGKSIDYALHSINNHDALVEALDRALSCYDDDGRNCMSDDTYLVLRKTLEDARGES